MTRGGDEGLGMSVKFTPASNITPVSGAAGCHPRDEDWMHRGCKMGGRNRSVTSQSEEEREAYNLSLQWLDADPPSSEELRGKLFKGWYQPIDITSYKINSAYLNSVTGLIDLQPIIEDIPHFILSWRNIRRKWETTDEENEVPSITNPPSNGNATSRDTSRDEYCHEGNARPLTHQCSDCRTETSDPDTMFLMIEYLVELSIPGHLVHHFKTFRNKVQSSTPRSRPQSARPDRTPPRWVFVACHGDVTSCYGNLFHTLDNFIPVLVVSYENYGSYVSVCGQRYVVVRLPATSPPLTTGYTHYWSQKLARKLNLEQVWLLDDQVKSFCKSVPNSRLPIRRIGGVWRYDVREITDRLVSYNIVMSHLERKMSQDETNNPSHPLSIIGFSNEVRGLTEPYYYNIPIGAILINLRNLKNLAFHPEIHQIDTQVLACEAVKSGQRVFVCNSYVLLDSTWDQE